MANADKCYLRIPYKDAIREIRVSDDGVVPRSLEVASDQMFQNLKAIENRINDPECEGGGTSACACQWALAIANGGSMSIAGGTSDFIDLAWTTINFQGSEDASFVWTISGGSLVPPSTAVNYRMDVFAGFTGNTGPDPIMAGVGLIDSYATFEDFCFMPDGFPGAATLSRPVDHTGLDNGSTFVTIQAPSASTASTTATVYAFVQSTCCPRDPGGG